MNAVQYWAAKARCVNVRCIWSRFPAETQAARALRSKYMAAARKAKSLQKLEA